MNFETTTLQMLSSIKYLYNLSIVFPLLCSFIRSIGMCRMRQLLAILRRFFHSSLLYTISSTLFHQLVFHPPSLHFAICFLVCLSALLFPNSYTLLFWEFYFLPFSVHIQTNIIYLNLLSVIVGFFNHCINFFIG